MAKFFSNLHLVIVTGVVLAIILIMAFGEYSTAGLANDVMRWLHLFFGVTWIGLLYYFNFVQIPTMPKIADELKPGVTKHIAPNALFFFRWAALFTVLTGAGIAAHNGYIGEALTFAPV